MLPGLLRVLRPPDFVSLMNAGVGFISIIAVAYGDFTMAASLLLVAAIADGLDGLVARYTEGGPIGVDIDSLGDAVSFGLAPAFLAHYVARDAELYLGSHDLGLVVSLVPIFYALAALVRLAAYNVMDADSAGFTGVPSTLAGVTIATVYLTGVADAVGVDAGIVLVGLSVVLAYLMLVQTPYPELDETHSVVMGAVVGLAALFPDALGSLFPYVLLFFLVVFLVGGPRLYRQGSGG
ncbi:MAG: CDP-alcohol phosphatidyltransferase family protein [Halobacteriales archaeon]